MPERETYGASPNCERSGSSDQDVKFTVQGIPFKVFKRPDDVTDEDHEDDDYTDEELMKFEDSIEDSSRYVPGGYHPVHLGDTLGPEARYRVLHKIGSGLSSTVWLCRDIAGEKYVAVKIIVADESEDSPELNYLKLKDASHEQSGGDKICIPESHFWLDGPNGTHLCLVLPVIGPPVPDILALAEGPVGFSHSISTQVVEGLEFLHRNGICHGDIEPANILLKITNFDDLTEDQIMSTFGKPFKLAVQTASSGNTEESVPDYLVGQINFWRVDCRNISAYVCIVDLGESYEISSPPEDLGIPVDYAAPEVIFDKPVGVASDIWPLGCTLTAIRSGQPLFGVLFGDANEVILSIIETLGKLPEPWIDSWKEFYDPGPELLSNESGSSTSKFQCLKETLDGERKCFDLRTSKNHIIKIPEDELEIFVDLVARTLTYDPQDRISIASIKAHPWFTGTWKENKEGGKTSQESKEGTA